MQVAFSQSKTGFGLDFFIIIIYIRIQIQAFFAGLDIVFTELVLEIIYKINFQLHLNLQELISGSSFWAWVRT